MQKMSDTGQDNKTETGEPEEKVEHIFNIDRINSFFQPGMQDHGRNNLIRP